MRLKMWRRRSHGPSPEHAAAAETPRQHRVSVVIPLYNHARFVARAVESALAQGEPVCEVVVVDDGSSDDSAAIVRGYCERDPRIVFWSQPNRGAHAAINAGLLRTTGDLVAVLNSDDEYMPGRLAALAASLDADPAAQLAASAISFIDDAGEAIANAWYEAALAFYAECGDLATALINGYFLMTTSNFVMRRSLIDEIGLFAPLRYMHDADFALRFIASGQRIALLDEPLLRYRVHPGNTIGEEHGRVREEWALTSGFFLHSLTAGPHRAAIDWERLRAIADVLQRHELARAVQLCTLYFARHPTATLEHSPVFADREFRALLRRCV